MKVIELLNKIANGEEVPKKIKYLSYEYEFNKEDKEYQRWVNGLSYGLGEDRRLDIKLDDEIEIIESQEHKIPEKLENYKSDDYTLTGLRETINTMYDDTSRKINEILDYLEEIE